MTHRKKCSTTTCSTVKDIDLFITVFPGVRSIAIEKFSKLKITEA